MGCSSRLEIPVSVLVSLLYIGLVRLFLIAVAVEAGHGGRSAAYFHEVLGSPTPFGLTLDRAFVAVAAGLLVLAWVQLGPRANHRWAAGSLLGISALLVLFGYALL